MTSSKEECQGNPELSNSVEAIRRVRSDVQPVCSGFVSSDTSSLCSSRSQWSHKSAVLSPALTLWLFILWSVRFCGHRSHSLTWPQQQQSHFWLKLKSRRGICVIFKALRNTCSQAENTAQSSSLAMTPSPLHSLLSEVSHPLGCS